MRKQEACWDLEYGGMDSLPSGEISRYKWESWVLPESKERLKESYYILKEKFQSLE